MGYYRNLLDQIMTVEQQGFNPYTESYTSRVGQLSVNNVENGTPESPNNTATQLISDVNVSNPETLDISQSFTKGGYDDPYANIINESGELDLGKLTGAYNSTIRDKQLGVDPQKFIDYSNTKLKKELESIYGEGKTLVRNPDNTLSISKDETPKKDETFRFSIGSAGAGNDRKDIYYRWDSEGNYITYNSKKEYDDAISEYKELEKGKEYKTMEDLDKENLTKKAKK